MDHLDHSFFESQVSDILSPKGLYPLGWFTHDGSPSLLIGDEAGSHWTSYWEASNDGKLTMDEWTSSTIAPVAESLDATAHYPFGETLHPFQSWAREATGMHTSPLGLLIHKKFGLWTALRAALTFTNHNFPIPSPESSDHPCESCQTRPCLTACPVGAFTETSYDVASCRTFISSQSSQANLCRTEGCRSRLACPIGTTYAYSRPQQSFHMEAFLSSTLGTTESD